MAAPLDTAELEALRDALIRARARGARVVAYEGRRIEYASDAEMAAALADLERRITATTRRPRSVSFSARKGV